MHYGRNIRAALAECWEWHGHGARRQALAKVGRSKNWLTEVFKGKGPNADTFEPLLTALGEDLEAFWRRVHVMATPDRNPLAMLDALPRHWAEPLAIRELKVAAKRLILAGETSVLPGTVANIDYLESFRRRSPLKAAELAYREVIEARTWPIFCKTVGIYASACRIGGRLELAGPAIRLGLRMADRIGVEEAIRAELLTKAAYVLSDHAQYENALRLTAEAEKIHIGRMDTAARGCCIVDAAVFSRYRGDLDEAKRAFEGALFMLPPTESSYRMTAYQNLAKIHREAGELDEAERYLCKAEALLDPKAECLCAWLVHTRGELALARSFFAEAEACFRRARDLFAGLNAYDSALAGIDLVSALQAQGRHSAAIAEALAMNTPLRPLKHNSIADAAMTELIVVAARGQLCNLAEARHALERARAQPLGATGREKPH